jgi:hypothetical protein
MLRRFDYYVASVAAGTESALACRAVPGLSKLIAQEGKPLTLSDIIVKCANTGFVILRVNGQVVAHVGCAGATAQTAPLPLEIPLAAGDELTVGHLSSSGTALCEVGIGYRG